LPEISRDQEFEERKIAVQEGELAVKEGDLELKKDETGGKEPKPTQRVAAGFAKRTEDAGSVISELGSEFTGLLSRGAGMVPQGLKSDQRQRFDQATRDFINATLRRESGAAIQQSEFDSARLQYIPQPGDSEAVLEQKGRNRETISRSLQLEAGSAFEELQDLDNTVMVLGKPYTVGQTVENSQGQRGIVEADGSISIVN
jgi:hypothetical protein